MITAIGSIELNQIVTARVEIISKLVKLTQIAPTQDQKLAWVDLTMTN